jgi:hypothetical protein
LSSAQAGAAIGATSATVRPSNKRCIMLFPPFFPTRFF